MWRRFSEFVHDYQRELVWVAAICGSAYLIGGILNPFLPIDDTDQAKLLHFGVGVVAIMMFWYALEHHRCAHLVNPIWLILGCIWGASGIFFIRWIFTWIGINFLRRPDTLLYTAFPDWDGVLFGWYKHHRHILFHSNVLPVLLLIFAIAKKLKPLRDFAIGLIVGVASHLVWDIIHGPFNNIKHLDFFLSALWMLSNALIGVFFAYYMIGKSALPLEIHEDSIFDSND